LIQIKVNYRDVVFKEEKVLKNSWLFLIVVLFVSCANLGINPGGILKKPAVAAEQPDEQPARQPAKYVELSMQEQHSASLWVSGPVNGQMVIIGVSGRLSRPDDEIVAAKEDAARKVSMYNGVQGSVELINTTGSGGFFDYSADSILDLQYDQNYGQYVERLTFDPEKDVLRTDGATFIRFQFNASIDVDYSPKTGGRPSWVNNRDLPEFNGYTTVVGYAGKRSRLRDTISASCDSAAAKLIESASFQVSSRETSVAGSSGATTLHIKSEGRLANFQILGFWIDPDNGSVSTLAIARVSK
jgi:hypothetical protein